MRVHLPAADLAGLNASFLREAGLDPATHRLQSLAVEGDDVYAEIEFQDAAVGPELAAALEEYLVDHGDLPGAIWGAADDLAALARMAGLTDQGAARVEAAGLLPPQGPLCTGASIRHAGCDFALVVDGFHEGPPRVAPLGGDDDVEEEPCCCVVETTSPHPFDEAATVDLLVGLARAILRHAPGGTLDRAVFPYLESQGVARLTLVGGCCGDHDENHDDENHDDEEADA